MVNASRGWLIVVLLSCHLHGCFDLKDLASFPCAADSMCPQPFTCLDNRCVEACTFDTARDECRTKCSDLGASYCEQINNCANLESDDENCGRCGTRCTNGTACKAGACMIDLTLGKSCRLDSDCPASAPLCVGIALPDGSGTTRFCTLACVTNASTTTDSAGHFSQPISPPPNDATCVAEYDAFGSPRCDLFLSWQPMDDPPKPLTHYGVSMGCLIGCTGNNTCAIGMVCDTTLMTCVPQ